MQVGIGWLYVAATVGAAVGMLVMALCVAGRNEEG